MSATLKPEDILTPEELAARLKVRKSWVYEQNALAESPEAAPTVEHGYVSAIRLDESRGVADED